MCQCKKVVDMMIIMNKFTNLQFIKERCSPVDTGSDDKGDEFLDSEHEELWRMECEVGDANLIVDA